MNSNDIKQVDGEGGPIQMYSISRHLDFEFSILYDGNENEPNHLLFIKIDKSKSLM